MIINRVCAYREICARADILLRFFATILWYCCTDVSWIAEFKYLKFCSNLASLRHRNLPLAPLRTVYSIFFVVDQS